MSKARVHGAIAERSPGLVDMGVHEPLLHHLAIKVCNLDEAERFWVDALGLTIIARHTTPDGQPRSFWVRLGGGAFLAIKRATQAARKGDEDAGWHCVSLTVTEQQRKDLEARLASFGHPVFRRTEYTSYVRAPEGAVIGFSHYPIADTHPG